MPVRPIHIEQLIFRPKKALRVIWVVFAFLYLLFFAGFSFLFQTYDFFDFGGSFMSYWYVIGGALFFCIWGYAYYFRSQKLEVDDTKMTYSSLFGTRSLALSDIKGAYNMREYQPRSYDRSTIPTFIPHKNSQGRKISTFFCKKLNAWARENFTDLDRADFEAEEAEILADKTLGATVKERQTKIQQATLLSNGTLYIGAVLIGLSFIFYLPHFLLLYYIVFASMVLLAALVYFKGLVRLSLGTPRVDASLTILVIAFCCVKLKSNLGFVDLSMEKWKVLTANGFIIVCLLTLSYIFIIVGKRNYKFKSILSTLLLFCALVFSNFTALNIILGSSEPTIHKTTILEYKEIVGTGRHSFLKHYDMYLKLWSKDGSAYYEVNVSRDTYTTLAPGTCVEIKEYQGAFSQKWFTVHHKGTELNEGTYYFLDLASDEQPSWAK